MKTYKISSPSSNSIQAVICDIGARLLELRIPQDYTEHINVITGPATLEQISSDQCFMGASVGRFGVE
mgnify:CR=1 FL=1